MLLAVDEDACGFVTSECTNILRRPISSPTPTQQLSQPLCTFISTCHLRMDISISSSHTPCLQHTNISTEQMHRASTTSSDHPDIMATLGESSAAPISNADAAPQKSRHQMYVYLRHVVKSCAQCLASHISIETSSPCRPELSSTLYPHRMSRRRSKVTRSRALVPMSAIIFVVSSHTGNTFPSSILFRTLRVLMSIDRVFLAKEPLFIAI